MANRPSVGEPVDYVSPFRTGTYDGRVTRDNGDGTVAVDVYLPGAGVSRSKRDLAEPAVRLRSVTYGPEGRARPRTAA